MIRSILVAVTLAVAVPIGLAACGQGVGERCQLNRDCQSNLTCVLPPNGTVQIGGTCQPNTTNLDMPAVIDFYLPPDLSVFPADLSGPHDMSMID